MATKVTILGMDEPKEKELKKIEFVKAVFTGIDQPSIGEYSTFPASWENIELVRKSDSRDKYDVMFAYQTEKRSQGIIYLGHFNDGIV